MRLTELIQAVGELSERRLLWQHEEKHAIAEYCPHSICSQALSTDLSHDSLAPRPSRRVLSNAFFDGSSGGDLLCQLVVSQRSPRKRRVRQMERERTSRVRGH